MGAGFATVPTGQLRYTSPMGAGLLQKVARSYAWYSMNTTPASTRVPMMATVP